ncbi:triacylglycerol lipase [Capronia coronata CBS 617.96]|uniref:Triacylglycerol lipase n=1 Tax=Capronia coronata CBS 617.96 TaxID=1182541 RepID=W9YMP9_9EURO|nr:triacylglycerol lipase [Capronia coronata CBS 617.96]EXJ83544.1 triacylglycerol lipase [Capronia coronata CBS 617.96]
MSWRALRLHASLRPAGLRHCPLATVQICPSHRDRRWQSTSQEPGPARPQPKQTQNQNQKPAINSNSTNNDKDKDNSSSVNNDNPSSKHQNEEKPIDGRFSDLGRLIASDYAHFQEQYSTPKHPIVLAHGLMGFDEWRLAGPYLPGIHYWRGITEAFARNGIECITTAVPRTGSIQERAGVLMDEITRKARGRQVNIVAHSMGGLDARYLISRLCPPPSAFVVRSLTTVATPHRGSSAADMVFRDIGPDLLPRIFGTLERLKINSGAFSQLTTDYVRNKFNPVTPNDPSVRYFSYGASATPHLFSVFRLSHELMLVVEGPNDGLVSVYSSKWGQYMGTLMGVTHLDLINWTNRLKRIAARFGLVEENFNAVAFYLGVADMLAKEGL